MAKSIILSRDMKTWEIPTRPRKEDIEEGQPEGIPAEELAKMKREMQKYSGLIK